MTKLAEKCKIESNILANILYRMGYEFYKCINGNYYDFDLRKHLYEENLCGEKLKYELWIIDCYDEKETIIFYINDELEIVHIDSYIEKHFDLPKGKIDIDQWEMYLLGGRK